MRLTRTLAFLYLGALLIGPRQAKNLTYGLDEVAEGKVERRGIFVIDRELIAYHFAL